MADRIAKSSSNPADRLAVRYGSARATFYRIWDEYGLQLPTKGIDPDSVIRTDPNRLEPTDPQPILVDPNDVDWQAFCSARNEYLTLKSEWETHCRHVEDNLQALYRVRAAKLRDVYRNRIDFDTSRNEAGEPNNPDEYRLGISLKRFWARDRKRESELIRAVQLPSVWVPTGWEGPEGPAYEVKSLADVRHWLQRELKGAQGFQYLDPERECDDHEPKRTTAACDRLNRTVRNLFRLFNALKICGVPDQPPDSSKFHEAERAVLKLLAEMPEMSTIHAENKAIQATANPHDQDVRGKDGDRGSNTLRDRAFVFESSGNTILVAGFGEQGHFRRLKGHRQIEALIRATPKMVSMLELDAATLDDRITNDRRSKQPIADAEALGECNERLTELESEIAKAQANNDSASMDRMEKEKAKLINHLASVVGMDGQSRDLNSLVDKLRPKIWGTINTAIKAMREALPPMRLVAEHFEANIASEGNCFVYRVLNDAAPPWELG